MIKKIYKNLNNDERIKRLIYKYGFESFAIMSLLLSGLIIYKNLLNGVSLSEYKTEFLVLAAGGLYFILRTAFGGIISLPDNKKERKIFIKYIVLGNIIFGFLFGTFISIRNTILYLDGTYNLLSLSILIITTISAMFFGFALIGIFLALSNYYANKNLKEQ